MKYFCLIVSIFHPLFARNFSETGEEMQLEMWRVTVSKNNLLYRLIKNY